MFLHTNPNGFRFGLALCSAMVCSLALAGDQEFGSVMAWGKLQIFKTYKKGALLHRTFDPARQEWCAWGAIARHVITSAPSPVVTEDGTRLAVYFRGKDGLLHQVYRDQNTGWSTVAAFGDRAMFSNATVVVVEGRVTVLAKAQDSWLMNLEYLVRRHSFTRRSCV